MLSEEELVEVRFWEENVRKLNGQKIRRQAEIRVVQSRMLYFDAGGKIVECGGMKLGCHVVVNRINDPMRKWDVNFEDFGFGDYRLSDEEFNDLVSFCGEVSVDYFVPDYSFGMRPFFSRYISGLSAGCVVFAQDWSRGFGFFCLSVGLVSRLMDEAREDGAKGMVRNQVL